MMAMTMGHDQFEAYLITTFGSVRPSARNVVCHVSWCCTQTALSGCDGGRRHERTGVGRGAGGGVHRRRRAPHHFRRSAPVAQQPTGQINCIARTAAQFSAAGPFGSVSRPRSASSGPGIKRSRLLRFPFLFTNGIKPERCCAPINKMRTAAGNLFGPRIDREPTAMHFR